MASLAEVRAALAAQIRARLGTGVRVHERYPDGLNVPAVVIRRESTQYDTTQGGQSNDLTLSAVVFVDFASPRTAQELLDQFTDPTGDYSIAAAVNSDPTLGGVVDFATVTEAGPDELSNVQGVDYLSAAVTVVVG